MLHIEFYAKVILFQIFSELANSNRRLIVLNRHHFFKRILLCEKLLPEIIISGLRNN